MKKIFPIIALLAIVLPANASKKFFDASRPESLFNIGVRLGINTTNTTVDKGIFDEWNCNSWGIGLNVGAVVDINIRNYLSIQPGFFFQSRSGKYAYVGSFLNDAGDIDTFSQFGSLHSYNFTIPVVANLHFNITDDVRWNVEVGPYIQIIMKNTAGSKFLYPTYQFSELTDFNTAKASNFDFGCKFGSSLTIFRHYTVGFNYEAGWLNAWKEDILSGRHKGWVFYLGYDF